VEVRFADAAVGDIEYIFNYISRDDPAAADRMRTAILAAALRLSDNPRLGRIGAMSGTFEVVIRPYVLVYEIHRTEIVVLRIWHGRQRRPGT
jgi:toxin ParE1/3/4